MKMLFKDYKFYYTLKSTGERYEGVCIVDVHNMANLIQDAQWALRNRYDLQPSEYVIDVTSFEEYKLDNEDY